MLTCFLFCLLDAFSTSTLNVHQKPRKESDLKEDWTRCVQKEQYCKPDGFLSSEKLRHLKMFLKDLSIF